MAEVPFQPVFILGDHRSGTTLLYQMLAESGVFNVVTAYHLIAYDCLLSSFQNGTVEHDKCRLADRFRELGIHNRMIDNVAATPDLPEEYGFLFKSAGSRPRLTPANLPLFLELCRKVQYLSGNSRPLLLKNPWDYPNFIFLRKVLSSARFVFLHRQPTDIINSQISATRSILREKNEYAALLADWYRHLFTKPLKLNAARILFSSPLGFHLTLRHVDKAASYFLKNIGALGTDEYISVRYEDLCEAPETEILRIVDFVGARVDVAALQLTTKIARRRTSLIREVARNTARIERRLESYRAYLGYS